MGCGFRISENIFIVFSDVKPANRLQGTGAYTESPDRNQFRRRLNCARARRGKNAEAFLNGV